MVVGILPNNWERYNGRKSGNHRNDMAISHQRMEDHPRTTASRFPATVPLPLLVICPRAM